MIKKNQRIINICNMISDGIIIFFSYYISLFIRLIVFHGTTTLPLWRFPYSLRIAVFSVAVVFVYYVLKMYGSYRFKAVGSENSTILMINGFSIITFTAILFTTRIENFPRSILFIYWVVSSTLIILKRLTVRKTLHFFRRLGYNQKHIIIVGNGHHAFQYIEDIMNNPHLGITIDGYVSKYEKEGLGKSLGAYEDLERILQEYDIDELIVALEPHEIKFMKEIIACADKEGIRISLIPFFNDYFPSHVRMEKIGNSKLIDMRATPLDNIMSAFIKRTIDIVGASIRIILFGPVMILTAIGVKLSSPGPVLFRQERIGLDKKTFEMLKFRSMRINDEESTGWSTNSDPRKTRFGSIIRKFSIDELPQFFNVLKGDMSLVGPRPEIPHYVHQFKENVPLYLVRQQVRPGITGWAQVNGFRGDTSIEERVRYDIWYIENWSLWLDIKILFRTAFGGWINNEEIETRRKDTKK